MKTIKVSLNLLYTCLITPFVVLGLLKILDIVYYVFFDVHLDNNTIFNLWIFILCIFGLFLGIDLSKQQNKKYNIDDLVEDLRYIESDLNNLVKEEMKRQSRLYASENNNILITFPYNRIIRDYINKQNK